MNFKQMMQEMQNRQASDLHLRVGIRPMVRADGKLESIDDNVILHDDMDKILSQILSDEQKEKFLKKREMDLALSISKMGRFRINLYKQRGTVGIAIRQVNTQVPSFEELNLPDAVKSIANNKRGLIIVTGTTG